MSADQSTHERTAWRDERVRVPHVVVSVLLGTVFVVASLLAALLPALAVVYLVVGFAIRDVVVVLVLWTASASLTVVTFLAISRTFVRAVLRNRVVPALPVVGPSED